MKYNYYILNEPWELYQQMMSNLEGKEGIIVNSSTHDLMGWKYPLWRIHTGKDFNSKISLPFKRIWNKAYLRNCNKFKDNTKPICFVLIGMWAKLALELGLCETIRKSYPNSKIVWYHGDLMHKFKPAYPKEWKKSEYPDMNYASEIFDKMISFDDGDCKKYGLDKYPLFYSEYKGNIKEMPHSDVYFCGQAKDRLPEIMEAYKKLKEAGLKLDFYLVGVPKDKRIVEEGIAYGSGLNYKENIQHLLHSKAVLEIMQKGGTGYTIRTNEVVVMGRKMITNNPHIKEAPFYNSEYISVFTKSDGSDIDLEFLKQVKDGEFEVDYCYKEKMSPIEFIKFLDARL